MRFPTKFAAITTAVLINSAARTDSCATAPYASCGSNAGTTCCPSGYYCQPWNANYFQCMDVPAQCSQQFTNLDYLKNGSSDRRTLVGAVSGLVNVSGTTPTLKPTPTPTSTPVATATPRPKPAPMLGMTPTMTPTRLSV
ncbi:putative cbel-like protein [Globisporangium polare]